MEWYSYFLISLPEAFTMIVFAFVLLGIPLQNKSKQIFLFSVFDSILTFSGELWIPFSYKVYILVLAYFLLVMLIFRFRWTHSIVVTIISFVSLTIFQVLLVVVLSQVLSLEVPTILAHPGQRILAFLATTVPMLLTAWILHRKKITIPFIKS